MGIVRTVEWGLSIPPDSAGPQLVDAMVAAGLDPVRESDTITVSVARSLRKNRWACEIQIDLAPLGAGTRAVCQVDMLGNKHYEVLDDIAERVGDDFFTDRGVDKALDRLGKASRIFGRKEVRHLRHLIRADEQVLALGQGIYHKKQGLVVLTDARLFFFEKSIGNESHEEFSLSSISSLEVRKKLGGERLTIHASGNDAEIAQMMHGQADEIARQFRDLKARPAAAPVGVTAIPEPDVLDQIRKLGELRDAGVLTADEFEVKKATLLERL